MDTDNREGVIETDIEEALAAAEADTRNGGNTRGECIICTYDRRDALETARVKRGLSYGAIAKAMITAQVPGVERYPSLQAVKSAATRHFTTHMEELNA